MHGDILQSEQDISHADRLERIMDFLEGLASHIGQIHISRL